MSTEKEEEKSKNVQAFNTASGSMWESIAHGFSKIFEVGLSYAPSFMVSDEIHDYYAGRAERYERLNKKVNPVGEEPWYAQTHGILRQTTTALSSTMEAHDAHIDPPALTNTWQITQGTGGYAENGPLSRFAYKVYETPKASQPAPGVQ